MAIETASYSAALAAYILILAVALRGLRSASGGVAFAAAGVFGAVWAAAGLAQLHLAAAPLNLFFIAEVLRATGWIWALLCLLTFMERGVARLFDLAHPLYRIAFALFVINLAVAWFETEEGGYGLLARLSYTVFGLLVIENAFRATMDRRAWAAKHMLIGLSAIFVFDFFLYSEALLLKQVLDLTATVRPFVDALAAPLIALSLFRLAKTDLEVGVSRRVVFNSAVLLASGIYLTGVAAAGFLLRQLGLAWGPVLQIVFMIAAVLCLVTAMSSAELRARLRRFVTQNFFRLSYDYREEWIRFAETMGGADIAGDGDAAAAPDRLDLHRRAIKATADLLDCSAGALYLRGRTDDFALAATWHWGAAEGQETLPSACVKPLRDGEDIVDYAEDRERGAARPFEPTAALAKARLALALRARGRLLGVLIVADQRAARPLGWEDRDLLKIFSREIGSYIGEEQVARALSQAQRFERMGKNFSFVAHDLKNIVSQLSLIVQQTKRHGENPEFQKDALVTVGEATEKMQALLMRLSAIKQGAPEGVETIDAAAILRDVARRKGADVGRVHLGAAPDRVLVDADPISFASILENLLQNALDAVGETPGARVEASCIATEESCEILIEDNGPGMTKAFIEDHLFQPFASTKESGFGLGMYQCREWLESWGGSLAIDSAPEEGARVAIKLPATRKAATAA